MLKRRFATVLFLNALLIEYATQDIYHYLQQIDLIDQPLDDLMSAFDFLTTIPSVGNVTGAAIIGDINHFDSPVKLLVNAGLNPSVYEAGNFKSIKFRISKRDSKYLRTAVFTATKVACIGKGKNNQFRKNMVKKGSGKTSLLCNRQCF